MGGGLQLGARFASLAGTDLRTVQETWDMRTSFFGSTPAAIGSWSLPSSIFSIAKGAFGSSNPRFPRKACWVAMACGQVEAPDHCAPYICISADCRGCGKEVIFGRRVPKRAPHFRRDHRRSRTRTIDMRSVSKGQNRVKFL